MLVQYDVLSKSCRTKRLKKFIMICFLCYENMYSSMIFHFFNHNTRLNFVLVEFYFKFFMQWFYEPSNKESFSCFFFLIIYNLLWRKGLTETYFHFHNLVLLCLKTHHLLKLNKTKIFLAVPLPFFNIQKKR